MRLQATLLALCAAQSVVFAATIARGGATWEDEVLHDLLNRPGLLTPNGRKLLAHQLKSSRKKAPQDQILNAFLGSTLGVISNIGIPLPPSKVPEVQLLKAEVPTPGAQRVKIRHGPYRLPALSAKNNLESRILGTKGISNTISFNAKKPCVDCVVLTASAELEYADGKPAPNADGAWFHHAVLMNSGAKVTDLVCMQDNKPGRVEVLFQSGNEKSLNAFSLPGSEVKSGYHIRPEDLFLLNIELMNMEDKENWVWLAISYDFIDSAQPQYPEYKEGKLLWLNLGTPRCGPNMINPFGAPNITAQRRPTKLVFSEHSVPWLVGFEGRVLATNGHMHDGGTSVDVFKNDDVICHSVPSYSKGATNMGMTSHAKRQIKPTVVVNPMESEHIGSQKPCTFNKGIKLTKGDTMHVQANYDFNQHNGMVTKEGYLDEVMGTVGVLVAVD